MAKKHSGKNRYINTKFWDDTYIVELDPSEKLLFLYFITNPLTNIIGVYEISLRRISFDTGFDKDMVLRILDRFTRDNKIKYQDGWIIIKNFIKNQKQSDNPNDNINKGIKNCLEEIPDDIRSTLEGPWTPSNYSNCNSNINSNSNSKPPAVECDKQIKHKFNTKKHFEKIWNVYPRKLGKDKAFEKFIKQVISEDDYNNIKIAVERFKNHHIKKQTKIDYIPYGSSWFNKDWRDWVYYEDQHLEKPKESIKEKLNYKNTKYEVIE